MGGALAQSPGTEKENMVLSMPIQVKQITRISKHCSSKVFGHVRLFFFLGILTEFLIPLLRSIARARAIARQSRPPSRWTPTGGGSMKRAATPTATPAMSGTSPSARTPPPALRTASSVCQTLNTNKYRSVQELRSTSMRIRYFRLRPHGSLWFRNINLVRSD